MANYAKYLEKKVGKARFDFSSYRAIDSAFTFDDANISDALDTITIVGHPYTTGDQVGSVLTAATGVTATVPNATAATAYWVIVVDKDTIALATSLALAKAGTKTALTAGGATVDQYLQRNSFGAIYSDLVIPNGAIVHKVYYDVVTTLKSWDGAWGAGNEDTATLKLGLLASDDIITAISIVDGTNPWDSGIHGTKIGSMVLGADASHDTAIENAALDAASMLKMTADTNLLATIAVDPISQGVIDVYVEYYI
jgi:hypothetical protein